MNRLFNPKFKWMLLVDLAVIVGLGLFFFTTTRCSGPPRNEGPEATEPPTAVVTPEAHEEQREVVSVIPVLDPKRMRTKGVTVNQYEVELGENYWTIAKKYGLDVRTLVGANPEMPFIARVGETLLVPSQDGVLHVVEKGETLKSIAGLYGAVEGDLKKANHVSWWSPLKAGDVLFIAGAKPEKMGAEWKNYYAKRGMFGMPFASWGRGWTSKFGMRSDPLTGEQRMHRGMDFKAKYGVEVFASAGGRVSFAGVSGGYGNLIILSHGNAYNTYYGHLSKIEVKQGQKVRRGQRIGRVGATGRVTGPHLHFEIRKNGKAIDPLPLI
jgi:LysM repeat protein